MEIWNRILVYSVRHWKLRSGPGFTWNLESDPGLLDPELEAPLPAPGLGRHRVARHLRPHSTRSTA